VAVDGSETTGKILDFALDLTEKYNAVITILTVSPSLSALGTVPQELVETTAANLAAFAKDIRKVHEEILSKAIAHAKIAKPNLTVSTMLREGDAATEIENAVFEGSFDLIVLGHKDQSKMRERVLGNVSEKVVHDASCPIIIVK